MVAPCRVRAEVAFTTQPLAVVPAFEDISGYLLVGAGQEVQITRGRSDEFAKVQPSTMQMVLDNGDGRFTPSLVSGAYYPNFKKGKRVRITTRPWDAVNNRPTNPGNFAFALGNPATNFSGMEASLAVYEKVNCAAAGDVTAGHFVSGAAGAAVTVTASGVAATFCWMAGNNQGANLTQLLPVRGRAYSAAIKIKAGTTARNVQFRVKWWKDWNGLTPSATPTTDGTATATTLAGFTTVKLENFTPPSDAVAFSFGLLIPAGSAVAGEAWYADELQLDEGVTIGTYVSTQPDIGYRFDGFLDSLPTTWHGGVNAETVVTASDRMARLSKSRTLRNAIEETIFRDQPLAYWPLGDASGSTQAAPSDFTAAAALVVTQEGAGGTLTFGNSTGPDTDGIAAVGMVPASAGNGLYLTGALVSSPMTGAATDQWVVECYFSTTATSGVLFAIDGLTATLLATGKIDVATPAGGLLHVSPVVNDGATHHLMVSWSGAAGDLTTYMDGVTDVAVTGATAPVVSTVYVGRSNVAGQALWNGVVAHFAIYPNLRPVSTFPPVLNRLVAHGALRRQSTAGDGESSDARIQRWAIFLGLSDGTTINYVTDTGLSTSVQWRDWTGKSGLSMMQEVETTEGGVLFFDGLGRLVFHSRSRRFSAAVALTLAAGEYGSDLVFSHDDFGVVNDARITKAGGSVQRAINAASIAEFDTYTSDETSISKTDNEVQAQAQFRANTYGTPLTRCRQVSVDVLTLPAQFAAVQAVTISSLVRLTGLPAAAPASTVDLFVEGWTERIGAEAYDFTFNCSPSAFGAAWQLDSAVASVLDSTTRLAY